MDKNVAVLVLFFALAILSLILIPRWRMKRAIRQVIRVFRKLNATSINGASTIDELGLRPRGMFEGMLRGRDYKPYALNILLKAGIIQMTEDDRYYLVEDKLATTKIEKR